MTGSAGAGCERRLGEERLRGGGPSPLHASGWLGWMGKGGVQNPWWRGFGPSKVFADPSLIENVAALDVFFLGGGGGCLISKSLDLS